MAVKYYTVRPHTYIMPLKKEVTSYSSTENTDLVKRVASWDCLDVWPHSWLHIGGVPCRLRSANYQVLELPATVSTTIPGTWKRDARVVLDSKNIPTSAGDYVRSARLSHALCMHKLPVWCKYRHFMADDTYRVRLATHLITPQDAVFRSTLCITQVADDSMRFHIELISGLTPDGCVNERGMQCDRISGSFSYDPAVKCIFWDDDGVDMFAFVHRHASEDRLEYATAVRKRDIERFLLV